MVHRSRSKSLSKQGATLEAPRERDEPVVIS